MNYKDTINLPKTNFPMKAGLVQKEPELLARWEKEDLYGQIRRARKNAPKFILHDGPPFANGDVHMGTALNKILKDFIVKSKSMTGHDAPYVPGWDCHGLPIEYKVVKSDARLTPLQVRQKSEAFARTYIDVQRQQFKRLGVLGDWEKPYLTLDQKYEADILRVFGEIIDQGLVYRGQKPVYWSTGCHTALAEAEVEYADKQSPAIFVKFEIEDQPNTFVIIWTTTPWTLPANLAVAIHPRLTYGKFSKGSDTFIVSSQLPADTYGKLGLSPHSFEKIDIEILLKTKLRHPFLNRIVPILAGDFVTADTGTGCVHIAPGHGQDDYNLGKHLGLLSPVDDQGRFTTECGVPELTGNYVFDSNKSVISLLESKGRLVAQEIITHSYPHCWRSKTPVIFRAVPQWFIRIDQIRGKALEAIHTVQWIPEWGENRIRGTLEARADWCISRQRSWGVPLPIFYNDQNEPMLSKEIAFKVADFVEKNGSHAWYEFSDERLCRELRLPSGLRRCHDTLDVWIDSGSSHRAILSRHPELGFPADVYLEGSDQHRGWFQSSLLTSVAVHEGKAPYRTVITNGFLVDLDGRKISKSNTYEKPKDAAAFVNKYGADVVRLWVASENYQNDIPLSEEIFTRIGDTYRSIRNTLRILLANLYDFDPAKDAIPFTSLKGAESFDDHAVDRWVLSRLQRLIQDVRSAYETYEFYKVYHAINNFCAVEISSLYVDITKDRMYCDAPASIRRRSTQTVMHESASALIRLMAPILSYTAEEAWGSLIPNEESVHLQLFPVADPLRTDIPLETLMTSLLHRREEVTAALEKARQAKILGKSVEARVRLTLENQRDFEAIRGREAALAEFFIVSQVELQQGSQNDVEILPPKGKRCARSWRWDETVGTDSEYPDVSARDAAALRIRKV